MTSDSDRNVALWAAYERLNHAYLVRDLALVRAELAAIDSLRRASALHAGGPDRATQPTRGSHGRSSQVDVDDLLAEYRRSHDRSTRTQLAEANRGLAASIAHDYRGRGVELDDLVHVAMFGIFMAIERYDSDEGVTFASFASRTVNAELKRYVQANTSPEPRLHSVQERTLDLRRATETLARRLGRAPTVGELAQELGIEDDMLKEVLTPREREIVGLAAQGHTNREIAELLKLSDRTVQAHLHHAYTKLGVRDRAQLTALFLGRST